MKRKLYAILAAVALLGFTLPGMAAPANYQQVDGCGGIITMMSISNYPSVLVTNAVSNWQSQPFWVPRDRGVCIGFNIGYTNLSNSIMPNVTICPSVDGTNFSHWASTGTIVITPVVTNYINRYADGGNTFTALTNTTGNTGWFWTNFTWAQLGYCRSFVLNHWVNKGGGGGDGTNDCSVFFSNVVVTARY